MMEAYDNKYTPIVPLYLNTFAFKSTKLLIECLPNQSW